MTYTVNTKDKTVHIEYDSQDLKDKSKAEAIQKLYSKKGYNCNVSVYGGNYMRSDGTWQELTSGGGTAGYVTWGGSSTGSYTVNIDPSTTSSLTFKE